MEVPDLNAKEVVVTSSRKLELKSEWDTIMAEREIYRMMETDMSMSMCMPTGPTPTRPNGPPPTRPSGPTPTTRPVESPVAPVFVPTDFEAPTTAPVPVFVPTDIEVPTGAPADPSGAPIAYTEREQAIIAKCMMTPAERSAALTDMVGDYSDLTETRASRALEWLDEVDPAIMCAFAPERVKQRFLVSLTYFTLGGEEWANCSPMGAGCVNTDEAVHREPVVWLDGQNECVWYGLRCLGVGVNDTNVSADQHFELAVIELPANNLAGPMPIEIYEFEQLRVLTMDGNRQITGQIPSEIGNLKFLEVLDLDENLFTGTLPAELFELTNMFAIDLNNNQLVGTLSGMIGNLRELNVLQLENNMMGGELPAAGLFLLDKIVALTVNNNGFTGNMEEICAVYEERREEFDIYLEYFHVDCLGDPPPVLCSCCICF